MTARRVLIATRDGVRPAVAIDPADLAAEVLVDLARCAAAEALPSSVRDVTRPCLSHTAGSFDVPVMGVLGKGFRSGGTDGESGPSLHL